MDCGHEIKLLEKIIDPIFITMCECCIKSFSSDYASKNYTIDREAAVSVIDCAKRIIAYAESERGKGDAILSEEIPKACQILEALLENLNEQINQTDSFIDIQQLLETTKKIIISLAHILLLVDDDKCRFFASRCVHASVLTRNSLVDCVFDEDSFKELNKLMLEIICNAETRQKELTSINQAAKISKILASLIQLMKNLRDYSTSPQRNESSHSHIELICRKIIKNLRILALSYKHRNYYNDHCPRNAAIFSKCQKKMNEIVSMNEIESHMLTCPEIRDMIKYIISISIFMSSECADKDLKNSILELCYQITSSDSYRVIKGSNEFISLESLKKMYFSLSELRNSLEILASQNLAEVIYKGPYEVGNLLDYFNGTREEWNSKLKDVMIFNRSLLNAFYFVAITSSDKDASLKLMRAITSMEEFMENIIKSQTEPDLTKEIKCWSNQFGYCITLSANVIDLNLFMKICGELMNKFADDMDVKSSKTLILRLNSEAYIRAGVYLSIVEKYEIVEKTKNEKLGALISEISSESAKYCEIINEMINHKNIEKLNYGIERLRKMSALFMEISELISFKK